MFPKIGDFYPKMDGENDLGGKPTIFGNIHIDMARWFRDPSRKPAFRLVVEIPCVLHGFSTVQPVVFSPDV